MGDGRTYVHEEDALEVACEDCHVAGIVRTLGWGELDEESRKIVSLRMDDEPRDRRFLVAARTGLALVNVFLGEDGETVLQGKLSGKRHPLKPPASACTGLGHDRVSCTACHSRWAPQCLECHTQRGTDGLWHEIGGDFRAGLPSLGVRGAPPGRIEPFVPGMILTLGLEPTDMERAFPPALVRQGRLERFFSPLEPHTTARQGRSCASCHTDPLALGLGRGTLRLETADEPHWVFEPREATLRDGLPADAWTGFLEAPRPRSTTRVDARPFTVKEQRRILRVGACLECHEPTAAEIERIYRSFDHSLEQVTPACADPGSDSR
jgi:hypothetical protein